jgi:hypothetical protein
VPAPVTGELPIENPVGTLSPTLVTVPTDHVRLALRSNVCPFIVSVVAAFAGVYPSAAAIVLFTQRVDVLS